MSVVMGTSHIRGRMRVMGYTSGRWGSVRPVFIYEVIDTARDVVLHRDNSCGFDSCLQDLRENVEICRKAWRMGVLKKKTWCS